MRRMYAECGLVHADLSEYNLLWYEGRVFVIDVSQSVEPTHENALGFLLRDCSNMSDFFSKAGIPVVMTPHQLFNFTTGMNIQAATEVESMLEVMYRTSATCTPIVVKNLHVVRETSLYNGSHLPNLGLCALQKATAA